MSSSIYLRIFLVITLGFGVLHVGSLLTYLYTPRIFYHGSGEYFEDIALRVEGVPLRWEGMEFHDLTRDNLFLYQYGDVTTVSTDADGFRSRRYDADSYAIAIAGDSTIYGSRLSDDETLPWILAEALEKPVFNGAFTTMSNMLAHPALSDVQVVFDAATERGIYPRVLKKRVKHEADDIFKPRTDQTRSMLEAAGEIPPQRYSLPLMFLNTVDRFSGDLRVWADGGEKPWLFLRHRLRPEELDETVALIVARKRRFDAMGIRYVYLPIPAKQNLYADDVDDYTRYFIPTLVARLRAEGVEAVDLTTPYLAHKDEGLFFAYDTHWNGKGTTLAAKIIAGQVFDR